VIPRAGLDLPAVNFPGERALDLIASIAVAVPLNRLAHELAEAAGVAVGVQLVQLREVLLAVAGLEPELGLIRLLGLIALLIPRDGRGGVADDELVDRQVELFTAGAELILRYYCAALRVDKNGIEVHLRIVSAVRDERRRGLNVRHCNPYLGLVREE